MHLLMADLIYWHFNVLFFIVALQRMKTHRYFGIFLSEGISYWRSVRLYGTVEYVSLFPSCLFYDLPKHFNIVWSSPAVM